VSLALQEYPGRKNPLDGVKKSQLSPDNPDGGTGMFQYFLKVCAADRGHHTHVGQHCVRHPRSYLVSNMRNVQAVPTTYVDVRNNTIPTYQYSVTEYFKVRGDCSCCPAAHQAVNGVMSVCLCENRKQVHVLSCSTLIWRLDRTSQVSLVTAGRPYPCTRSKYTYANCICCYTSSRA
jgi:hypothetical protein